MSFRNLQHLLEKVAAEGGSGRIICYPLGSTTSPSSASYPQLLQEARRASWALRATAPAGIRPGSPVLLHFTSHWDHIVWFWAVLLAGGVPVMSTALSNNESVRTAHLAHLSRTLQGPLCLTRARILPEFAHQDAIQPLAIESFDLAKVSPGDDTPINPGLADTGVILLTSGSTGSAKAVCLSHGQILAAIAGKMAVAPLPGRCFMNWISLDHVAAIIEIHLLAMLARGDQVHAQGADILTTPTRFLDLIDTHRVARTFAPNFFLAKIRTALEGEVTPAPSRRWDLGCLHCINSGGEANVTRTCEDVTAVLVRYGAPPNVIVPGFGMTETCAGAIFNMWCPEYDRAQQREFASLGTCMPGIQMRITDGSPENVCVAPGETGNLEVTGPAVFKGYFNTPTVTAECFTSDGWFKTGDRGFIDANGYLNLMGRAKDTIIVNGVKYDPHTIEIALDEARIPGLAASFNCCFSSLPPGGETEEICLVYLPTYDPNDVEARVQTTDAIANVVMMSAGARPRIIPLNDSLLQKSALGKLSRARIKASYERGEYQAHQDYNDQVVRDFRQRTREPPRDELEETVLAIFVDSLGLDEDIGVLTPIFDLGITSIELIKLKKDLDARLKLHEEVPITVLLMNQTVRALSEALRELQAPRGYNPVVMLQSAGTKTPLWLVHPGVGEVLVFLNLANLIKDRAVYALRARGFNPGEEPFANIEEAVTIYHAAIKQQQPRGPYALAGYSYGSMLAFEVGKVLERNGDTVGFVGSFNLPPHIKARMRQLDFKECLLHLSYFLDLMTEARARELASELQGASQDQALAVVMQNMDPHRAAQLALSKAALLKWATLAFGLQSMAVDYEPSGSVASLDCFYCIPLAVVASSKQQWLEEHLSKWTDFTRSAPRFHGVDGAHYTMLSPEHVFSFQKTLRQALENRGL
ncbi:acetyl-CoA synthetase-like protein [Aspergillus heteromorphus CBS 117.55]|uniref:Acetyl-CoA synthetase-like protein n=1 Tax=Aspergillus heteromorphus CBS 117.55 TaxID=1448321 RepID=A0A317V104_9EURO|nr:acetyl-CoA synthetase-like protein [Aspergillus heteromorphus CBS 117.55]PWY67953.1 acetyl-CoA synthetase-like protein [Aspergillus heteromorphus CBS 117.55]